MVMGPTHAVSGTTAWLVPAAFGVSLFTVDGSIQSILLHATICAGATLAPDIDSPGSLSMKDGSTAVRAFGFVGEGIGHAVNTISVVVRNLIRTRHDGTRNNGHRTLTHTIIGGAFMSGAIAAGASLPGTFELAGREWAVGTLFAFAVMWAMLHLALFGLFEKWTKKKRAKYGLIGVMLISAVLTYSTFSLLPSTETTYPTLGLAVFIGMLTHCLGDAITKMGSPLFWPIPIRGKMWYEVALPGFMRIRAGGTVEYMVLFPALVLASSIAVFGLTPAGKTTIASMWSTAMTAFGG